MGNDNLRLVLLHMNKTFYLFIRKFLYISASHLTWKLKWVFLIAFCPSVRPEFPSIHPSVRLSANFSHVHNIPKFQSNLAQSPHGLGEFNFSQMKDHALLQGEIIPKYGKYMDKIQNLPQIEHWCFYYHFNRLRSVANGFLLRPLVCEANIIQTESPQ